MSTLDKPLCTYPISSADMRYIEISERAVYLRQLPQIGPILRGELSGGSETGHAGLAELLLEFVMSCEGCRDNLVARETAVQFGRRLGQSLVAALFPERVESEVNEQLATLFSCLLHSMDVPFIQEQSLASLRYTLTHDPLQQAAQRTGINRGVSIARITFLALCAAAVTALSPDWLVRESESESPLSELLIVRSES